MNNFGFLITAYQQLSQVEQQIQLIRNCYTRFNNSPIFVVTTSETDIGFKDLMTKYKDVKVIDFPNAPGSSTCDWFQRRPNPEVPYWSWRHEFLPARIMYSMKHGMAAAYACGLDMLLHLHSDTYWLPEAEYIISDEIEYLNSKEVYVVTDVSLHEEEHAAHNHLLPSGLHWLPEAMLLNLKLCNSIGFGFEFDKIFDLNSEFKVTNYGMIERLFGTFFHWCLTGKNITKYTDVVDPKYFESVLFRCNRTYHGNFKHIANLPGTQPDGK